MTLPLGKLLNRANILAATAEMRGPDATPAPVRARRSTLAQRKADAAFAVVDASDFGCQQENVTKLVAVLLGVEVPSRVTEDPESSFKPVIGALYTQIDDATEFRLIRDIDSDGDIMPIDENAERDGLIGGAYEDTGDFRRLRAATEAEVVAWCDRAGL